MQFVAERNSAVRIFLAHGWFEARCLDGLEQGKLSPEARKVHPIGELSTIIRSLFLLLLEFEWVVFGVFEDIDCINSSSRSPYARRWITRVLLFNPSTKPSDTLFSGWQ